MHRELPVSPQTESALHRHLLERLAILMKAVRQANHYSQNSIARAINMDARHYGELERAVASGMTLLTIARIFARNGLSALQFVELLIFPGKFATVAWNRQPTEPTAFFSDLKLAIAEVCRSLRASDEDVRQARIPVVPMHSLAAAKSPSQNVKLATLAWIIHAHELTVDIFFGMVLSILCSMPIPTVRPSEESYDFPTQASIKAELLERIGRVLQRVRENSGYASPYHFASVCGINASTYRSLERATARMVTFQLLMRCVVGLDLHLPTFLDLLLRNAGHEHIPESFTVRYTEALDGMIDAIACAVVALRQVRGRSRRTTAAMCGIPYARYLLLEDRQCRVTTDDIACIIAGNRITVKEFLILLANH